MPNLTADRVKETTTTTGTGTITLAGAVAQYRSFASAFADGSVVQYAIVGQTGAEWEVGNGTFTASGTTLARTTVLASSNANAAVNFSAGTKDVFATITAAELATHVVGPASVTDNALAFFDSTTGKLTKSGRASAVVGQAQLIELASGTGSNFYGDGSVSLTINRGSNGYLMALYNKDNGAILFARSTDNVSVRQALNADSTLTWSSSYNNADSGTTGLGRFASGVAKITDGSTGIRSLQGGGAAVASAAALPVPTGRVFHVTGTTNITSITSTNFQAGVAITLIFDGVLTVTDGSNLKLAGNFVTAADSTLSLVYDGTNWYETSRSTN